VNLFPSRNPSFIFRLPHLQFFRYMSGCLNFSISSRSGSKIETRCDVTAFLSFVPANPMASIPFLISLANSLRALNWSMFFFSSSQIKNSRGSSLSKDDRSGVVPNFCSVDTLHSQSLAISSTMKSSQVVLNFAGTISSSFAMKYGI